jgi:chromosome segregation protein
LFLKSIDLLGFKSFADKSHIEFSPGISALLGPNGCGKSNVVDAIKWVLGEQGTKSLRADRMEDVIFNGTEDRKPLGVAEVTLTLGNSEGLLPVDMPEITVKRRLYRSGESEYFINQAQVRLKEIRELFYDTGIGKSAYSIMEQGKIDQVLSNKPEERRVIFEEAAGITKYKLRGQEAERKLERTQENVRQVESVLKEVTRSYETLRAQSEKTLRYRTLKDESFELELDLQLLRLRSFLAERDKRSARLETQSAQRDATRKKIDAINEELESNLDVVNSMESKLIEVQKRIYGFEIEKGNVESQMKLLAERISEASESISAMERRRERLSEQETSLVETLEEQRARLADYDGRLSGVEQNIAEFKANIEERESSISANETTIESREASIRDAEAQSERLALDLRAITDDIVGELDRKLAETGYSEAERRALEAHITEELAGTRILMDGRAQRLRDEAEIGEAGLTVELARELGTQLAEGAERLSKLEESFREFVRSVPSFVDEFLAPEGIITKKRSIDEAISDLSERVRSHRGEIADLSAENREHASRISEYRKTLEELRVNFAQMKAQRQALSAELSRGERDLGELIKRRDEISEEIAATRGRVTSLEERVEEQKARLAAVEQDDKALRSELGSLQEGISSRNRDLADKERRVKGMMDELAKAQLAVEKLQMQVAESNTEIKNIYDNFRDQHSRDLSEYEGRIFDITADTKTIRERLSAVREELRSLGTVNLMAPEEFVEVKERYEFLTGQLEDLRKARTDLERITEEIQRESAELFLDTYEKIRKNFHTMFRRLFGGGRAEVKLTETDNVLESGVDLLVQPPGKKLESISLLSGGERSLTAVALLFATYMVKPSPFCLLDEIDAALDENNVGRFIDMLGEFSKASQFIVITHNKKTVAGAQTLLGVTMEDSGVSKVLAIRLDNREPVHAES